MAAAARQDGSVLLAGFSMGTWAVEDINVDSDMAAILIDTGGNPAPTPNPVIQPSPVQQTPAPKAATESPSVSPTRDPYLVSPTQAPTAAIQPSVVSPSVPTSPGRTTSPVTSPLGLIIGGVVGGAALLVIVAFGFRRRHVASRSDKSLETAPPPQSHGVGTPTTAPAKGISSPRYPVSLTEAGDPPSPHYPVMLSKEGH